MLNHKFDSKTVYKDFTLTVDTGDKLLIKGNSGCGKSTLFKIALGLLIPDSGTVRVNKMELNPENIQQIRAQIFYLDQEVNLPHLKVSEAITEILAYKSNRLEITTDKIYDLFKQLNLENEIYNKNIKDLSGGERQRIGIIIGLLLDRPIWLLDEPTSALDSELKDRVVSILTAKDITMLVTSHDECWSKLKHYRWVKR